jgi:hypothetical protein
LNTNRPALSLAVAAPALALAAGSALAQPYIEPINGLDGHIYVDFASGQQLATPLSVSGRDVYSSLGMPIADWGWSSPDMNTAEEGDYGNCVGRGLMHENDFTVYNGAQSAGPLTSLTMTIKIYNELQLAQPPSGAPFLGQYSVNLSWPSGLQPGWYSVVTVTNLDSLGIILPAITTGANPPPARFMWVQSASNVTGDATRIGFANNSTVTLGSSGQSLYIHDSTHPAVFELLNNPQTFSNPGFRMNVCGANCDGSTSTPLLNVNDFTCFLQRFAQGDVYANCDGSSTPPVLNVSDFTCFLQRYAQGCP